MRELCRTGAIGILLTYRLTSLEVGFSWLDVRLLIPLLLKRQLLDLNVKN